MRIHPVISKKLPRKNVGVIFRSSEHCIMRAHPVAPNNSFRHDLKTYFKEYCKISNIHGVHYLISARTKVEKFFWAAFLLISTAFCVYMIVKIYEKYENNPIVINFDTKQHTLSDVPFPAVTFCPLTKTVSWKFNYTDVYFKWKNNESMSEDELRKFSYLNFLCEHNERGEIDLSTDKFIEEDFYTVIDEVRPNVTIDCDFQLDFVCNDKWIPLMTEEGICFTFNVIPMKIFREKYFESLYRNVSDFVPDNADGVFDIDSGYPQSSAYHPFRAYRSGREYSLTLTLTQSISDVDPVCDSLNQGFQVLIHNPFEIPSFSNGYIDVPFNKKVTIGVNPDFIITSPQVKQFHPDKRKCYLSTEHPLMFFRSYTKSNCMLECLTNYTLEKCGCVLFNMPRIHDMKICGTATIECVDEAENDMYEEFESCGCKPSCNDWQYKVETSQSDYDMKKHLLVRKVLTDGSENAYSSMVIVYFKNDQFMPLQRKELYNIFDFISNFGGLMGLFLGFSLGSFVEIVYFLTLRPLCNKQVYGSWMNQS